MTQSQLIHTENDRYTSVTQQYLTLLDTHLTELMEGKADKMYELVDIAKTLCISQKHLIKIIKDTTGQHPCHFYIEKILHTAKYYLTTMDMPIVDIAVRLTYDPSNFTKFFKKYIGMTPSQYRNQIKAKSSPVTKHR